MGSVGYNGLTGTRVPVFHPLLTNTASMLAGVERHQARMGRAVTALARAGDGGAADVGFQSLSGAAERGAKIFFVVIDNEGDVNTGAGIQLHALRRLGRHDAGRTRIHGHEPGREKPAAADRHASVRVRRHRLDRLYGELLRSSTARSKPPGAASPTCTSARPARPAGVSPRTRTWGSRTWRSRRSS
jgi:hypothetical protein